MGMGLGQSKMKQKMTPEQLDKLIIEQLIFNDKILNSYREQVTKIKLGYEKEILND